MSSILVLDRQKDSYTAIALKGRSCETTIVNSLDSLRELARKYPSSKTIMALGPDEVIIELLNLPVEKDSELAQAVEFSMEDQLPYPAQKYLFCYKKIKTHNGTTRVLVCVVLKEVLENKAMPLKDIGIEPHEARPVVTEALNWCLERFQDKTFIVVLQFEETYVLAMFEEREINFLKTSSNRSFILLQLQHLRKAYQQAPVYWAGPEPPEDVRKLEFQPCDIYGTLPRRGGILSLSFKLKDTTEASLKKIFYMVVALALVLNLLGALIPYIQAKTQVSDLRQQIRAYKEGSSAILKEIATTEKKIKLLQQVQQAISRGARPVMAINRLSDILPEDVQIERLRITSARIELTGYAPDTLRVLNALKKANIFTNINSITTSSNRKNMERFIIKMEYKENE